MKRAVLFFFAFLVASTVWAQRVTIEEPYEWYIYTDDNRYLIQDHGYTPPPRSVIVKEVRTGRVIFRGLYYGWDGPEDIDLQGTTITIVKNSGSCYNDRWTLNKDLTREESNFARNFMNTNRIPHEYIEYQRSGLTVDLFLEIRYNFITGHEVLIGGFYALQQ